MTEKLWWHMYGGVTESGGIWMAVVAGGSEKPPEEVEDATLDIGEAFDLGPATLHYLGSWDHEPTEEEKEALTPERFREEVLDG